jgi:integrase
MTNKALTTLDQDQPTTLTVGQQANAAAARWVFTDYRSRKATNTLANHAAALAAWADFLNQTGAAVGLDGDQLATDPNAWRGVTWGMVEAFKVGLLNQGYSVGTVNNRLSAVRVYATLASKAGVIAADELTHIKAVSGYGRTEGKRVNERRPVTRVGSKKADPVTITLDQARRLKRPTEDTPQAARDTLIMCLLLDHGLRLSELAGLTVEAFSLDQGLMTFYRPKVDMTQTHKLTADTLTATRRYLDRRPSVEGGALFVASDRRGGLLPQPITARAIAKRVNLAGVLIGLDGLSPHDGRHYWTDSALDGGTRETALMDAGGWASRAMIDRYRKQRAIANEGVILSL